MRTVSCGAFCKRRKRILLCVWGGGGSAIKSCNHGADGLRTLLRPAENPAYVKDTLALNYTEQTHSCVE